LSICRTVKDEEYMKIDSLSKLLNAFGSSLQQSKNGQANQEKSEAVEEAVRVSSDLKSISNTEVARADNRKKIEDLKAQVQQGTYKPKTSDIAGAVARELFA
jgi:negative regulator of flagellin synthesis FlgM